MFSESVASGHGLSVRVRARCGLQYFIVICPPLRPGRVRCMSICTQVPFYALRVTEPFPKV